VRVAFLPTRRKGALTAPTEKAGTGFQNHLKHSREKTHHSLVWKMHSKTGNSSDVF